MPELFPTELAIEIASFCSFSIIISSHYSFMAQTINGQQSYRRREELIHLRNDRPGNIPQSLLVGRRMAPVTRANIRLSSIRISLQAMTSLFYP